MRKAKRDICSEALELAHIFEELKTARGDRTASLLRDLAAIVEAAIKYDEGRKVLHRAVKGFWK